MLQGVQIRVQEIHFVLMDMKLVDGKIGMEMVVLIFQIVIYYAQEVKVVMV